MAIPVQAWPFDNVTTSEEQSGSFFNLFQVDGIDDVPGSTSGQVTAGSGFTVNVAAFAGAFAGGAFGRLPIAGTITLDAASSQPRIDRIILQINSNTNVAVVDKKTGDPGTGIPKTLTQNVGGVYEIPLARIAVGANALNVVSANITDDRTFVGTLARPYTTATRPSAAAFGVGIGLNYTTKKPEFSDGVTWKTLTLGDATTLAQRWTGQLNNASAMNAIPSGVWTTVPIDTVLSDPLGAFAPGYGTSIDLPWSGLYRFLWRVTMTAPATNVVQRIVFGDGSGVSYHSSGNPGADGACTMTADAIVDRSVPGHGNVRFQVQHSSGTPRALSYADEAVRPRFTIQYLGPA